MTYSADTTTATGVERSVHAAVWQGSAIPGDTKANLQTVSRAVRAAADQGVELVLFPELFLSGYDNTAEELGALALHQSSEELQEVCRLARDTGTCIALPYAERDSRGALFNACALFDASGRLALNYRKVNLWGPWEQATFARGTPEHLRGAPLALRSGLTVRCGVIICYDVEFPEPARCLARQGVELLLVPTALGAGDVEAVTPFKVLVCEVTWRVAAQVLVRGVTWRVAAQVLPTRALENHLFVLYANLEGAARCVAEQNVPSFCGRSCLLAPDGEEILRGGGHIGGGLLSAVLRLSAYAASVKRNPYLADCDARLADGHYSTVYPPPSPPSNPSALPAPAHSALPAGPDVAESERTRVAAAFLTGLHGRDFPYGALHEAQRLRLYLPEEADRRLSTAGRLPVAFLVHGGFWKSKWGSENTQSASLVPDFLCRGFAVALVEYRRREMPGGGWPGTEQDVMDALGFLRELEVRGEPLDLERVVVIGHSAGGQLALVTCGRAWASPDGRAAQGDCASSSPAHAVRPCLCVAIAATPDMMQAHEAGLSDEGDAVERYMGCLPDSATNREKYAAASAQQYLPLRGPTLLVSGTEDTDVPPALLADFHALALRAAAEAARGERGPGDPLPPPVELLSVLGADHYQLVTAGSRAWRHVARRTTQMLQEHCGWLLAPQPADYSVTRERGFLPERDPPLSILEPSSDGGVANIPPSSSTTAHPESHLPVLSAVEADCFARWEACVARLPGLLCIGQQVRAYLAKELPNIEAGAPGALRPWQLCLLANEGLAERAFAVLAFLTHGWVWGEEPIVSRLPRKLAVPLAAVADIVGRPPILTYFSFNAANWQRVDMARGVELGNTQRALNFLGGRDEEWFSAVHVAIEAQAGEALLAVVRLQRILAADGPPAAATPEEGATPARTVAALQEGAMQLVRNELRIVGGSLAAMTATLRRMKEHCDPYIYYMRVRLFMSGWTHEALPHGMEYERVPSCARDAGKDMPQIAEHHWRRERYFGETGAQSSVLPALDAALGIAMSEDDLSPYLKAMRDYMPPHHAEFMRAIEHGPSVRKLLLSVVAREVYQSAVAVQTVAAYNECIDGLTLFRGIHFELAYAFVRKFDERKDDEIRGTGGTPFMPYLKKHRVNTADMKLVYSEEPSRQASIDADAQ
ncbi:hypothetical protein CYMTET_51138 [Cymbomonas tetramitiformis]|uniref:protein-S-isoprenylcysteine alpha-carbonyl methylesterase n=1 Tax=Cymbomonas tetramitiformis TaxID=36881 RepID=A0AAE0BLT6_9CHLO|nr:hypothetical protein CYMTET_51138 [Cymbomonas tetramitiformis]